MTSISRPQSQPPDRGAAPIAGDRPPCAAPGSPTDATSPARPPIRVLIWSPLGSGTHYHGPATFSYRLYGAATPGRFRVSLAHGLAGQERLPLFARQELVHPLNGGRLDTWRFLRRATGWVRENAREFDVLHGMVGYHTTMVPAHAAQRAGLPSVVWIANHEADLADKPGLKRLVGLPRRRREMAAQLSGLVAMSQAIHDELRGYGFPERKIARIPNAVDTARFRPVRDRAEAAEVRRELGWPERPTLCFVGGVTERKRPHLLVEAIALLRRRGVECQLALVGPPHDVPYVAAMKARIAELAIAELVTWHGFTEDISTAFRGSEIFSLPSSNEGMSAAVVEAMATGLPAVVTGISGMTDVVEDGVSGRIIEPTADSIAEAVGAYVVDPALARAHGAAALERALSRYSATVVLDAHEAMFRRIMAGGDAAG